MKLARGLSPIRPRSRWRPPLPHAAAGRRAYWRPLALLWRRRRAVDAGATVLLCERPTAFVMATLHLHFGLTQASASGRHRAPTGKAASRAERAHRQAAPSPIRAVATTRAGAVFRTSSPGLRWLARSDSNAGASAIRSAQSGALPPRRPAASPTLAMRGRSTLLWRGARVDDGIASPLPRDALQTTQAHRRRRASAVPPSAATGMLVFRGAASAFSPACAASRPAPAIAVLPPPRVRLPELVWRETTTESPQARPSAASGALSSAEPAAAPAGALRQAQTAPAALAALTQDRAAVDCLAREVIGRVEKHIRIERERRGA